MQDIERILDLNYNLSIKQFWIFGLKRISDLKKEHQTILSFQLAIKFQKFSAFK